MPSRWKRGLEREDVRVRKTTGKIWGEGRWAKLRKWQRPAAWQRPRDGRGRFRRRGKVAPAPDLGVSVEGVRRARMLGYLP